IAKDGIYLIDGKYLADSKLDVANVTPNDIRIVRAGMPVETSALDDGSLPFAQGGRLIFYATGNESPETAEASYFLRIATPSEAPTFMKVAAQRSEAPSLRRTFIRTYVNEKDELFQTRMGAFLSVQKMLWTWAEIKPGEGAQIDFDVPGFSQVDAAENTSATLNLYSRGDGVSPPANYRILVNDEEITTRTITSTATPIPLAIPSKLLRETANRLTIKTDAPADPKAHAVFIDSLSLTYTSIFAGKNGALALELPKDDAAADSRLQVTGLRGQHVVALKISGNSLERLNVQASRGTALVDAHTKAGDRLIFMEESQIPRPAPAQPTEAEPLSRDGDADILVIYHNVHQEAATLLAKNLNDAGMHAVAIDVQRIFDAYNYGDLSTNAIRDFLADAVHSWSGRRPDAVILIGDACGDGRNVSRQDVPNQIPIHSLASRGGSPGNRISSDSYYSWLNDGDQATDLIVSRISASLPQESLNAVKNIIRYRSEQETPSDWKQRIMLIADTGGFSTAVNNLAQEYASDFSEEKVLLVDDLPWEDNYYLPPTMISRSEDSKVSPAMTTAIDAVYAAGCGASLFFGHGAPNLWSNQRFWFGGGTPNSDILRMNVTHKLPFVASFTCNNAVIDYPLRPWNVCIAEDFMRYEGKGAIGCFMPSGPGYVTNHEMLADGFLRGWTLGVREHGVLCEMSRINHQVRLEVDNHTRMFIELGDPTLKLAALSKTEAKPSSGENSLIQRVVTIDEPTSATLSGQWSIALVNRSSSPELARLKIRTLDEQGTTLQEEEREVPMDPGAEKPVRFAARFPAVGVYRIRAELESASGRFQLSQLPSRIAEQRVIIPPATGALKIADDSVQLRAGNSVVPKPSLVYTVVNLGGQAVSADIKATGTIDGAEVFSFNRKSDRVEPGKQLALNDAVALPTLVEKPVTIKIVWTEITADKREIGSGSFSKTFSAGDFSDLRIVPGSVTLDPAQPFDGGTVFVRGEVENIGAALSPPTTISMFKASDEARSQPLRDFTTATGREVAPLKPGEKRPFTLRWDTSDD
ncbi:hypothetical protein IT571_00865, partial [Candidatus Sumerlaeota bacterium]|nr:hypothetical protein [Candidatus Sumerlaeota bacterium]